MKNKEFLEFLTGRELPPTFLKEAIRKDISLSFHGKTILARFVVYQLIGACVSLSVCPQFGVGLIEGHGISHYFRMLGDLACAAFCGSFFLSAGLAMAFLGMKGEELWWVWNHFKWKLILLPALLWSGLMLSNVSLELPVETVSYHIVWFIMAIVFLFFGMKFQAWKVSRTFLTCQKGT